MSECKTYTKRNRWCGYVETQEPPVKEFPVAKTGILSAVEYSTGL